MCVRGVSFRFSLLSLAVLAAVIRESQAACADTASDCTDCSTCTSVVYSGTSTKAHAWISNIDDSDNPGSGTCTDLYNPKNPITSNLRPLSEPPFCSKRVWYACSGGSKSSIKVSCSSSPSPSPPSPPSPSPVNPNTCAGSPGYCSDCADCLDYFRTSDRENIYYWVATDPTATEGNSPGQCVQRFDPPITGDERPVDSKDLCGKRVFLACSFSSTQSILKSCPLSAGSALQASTTVTASVVAAFALYLIVN
jgi:hypothetical protein